MAVLLHLPLFLYLACTPYADRILAYVSSVGAHRQLLVAPGNNVSNRELLAMVDKVSTRLPLWYPPRTWEGIISFLPLTHS